MHLNRFSYSAATLTKFNAKQLSELLPLPDSNSTDHQYHWVDIDGHLSKEQFQQLATTFELHPVEVDYFQRQRHRPRVEYYANHLVISIKMLTTSHHTRVFNSESVWMILGKNYLVTLQSGKTGDVFNEVRAELNNGQSLLRTSGSDYLAVQLLSKILENYFVIIEAMDDHVEDLEAQLVEDSNQHSVQQLYRIKRELVILRKAIWPLREVIMSLERTTSSYIQTETKIYLRDTYEQTIQAIDSVESLRDLMSGMLEIYLSSLSNRMNGVIKVLTIITTIFMPLTLITGIYGMNFHYLPGLESWMGPWEVIIGMAVVVLVMLAIFKHKKWL